MFPHGYFLSCGFSDLLLTYRQMILGTGSCLTNVIPITTLAFDGIDVQLKLFVMVYLCLD